MEADEAKHVCVCVALPNYSDGFKYFVFAFFLLRVYRSMNETRKVAHVCALRSSFIWRLSEIEQIFSHTFFSCFSFHIVEWCYVSQQVVFCPSICCHSCGEVIRLHSSLCLSTLFLPSPKHLMNATKYHATTSRSVTARLHNSARRRQAISEPHLPDMCVGVCLA